MSRNRLIIIAVCAAIILGAIWGAANRNSPRTSPKENNNSSKTSISSTIAHTDRSAYTSNNIEIEVADSERAVATDIALMTEERDMLVPLEQEARSFAKATANMSIAQMAELQKVRQGTVIRGIDGGLESPYVKRELCEDVGGCKTIIANSRTKEIIWDGNWAKGYAKTGVGQEVTKVE